MIRGLLSLYAWRYPATLIYMLQNTEYEIGPYLRWYWQTLHFERVMYRRQLKRTRPARLLLGALRVGMLLQICLGVWLIIAWASGNYEAGLAFGLAAVLATPVVWAHLIAVPLTLGRILIIKPRQWSMIQNSRSIFAGFTGIKIAVAGSYGKTSMKELLVSVLSQGKHVAATPANENVAISHARFAHRLKGNEDILIIEYGEGGPGDVARFADITKPTHAIITGLAPAHLDKYKTLHAAGSDIFSLAKVVPTENLYINAESPDSLAFVTTGQQLYSSKNVLGWRIRDVHVGFDGTRFTMHRPTNDGHKKEEELKLHSALLGEHQVGPLALVAALAHDLGLTKAQITAGVAATKPFDHRMQPYQLGGAWIIDDTYNGNIDGIRAGAQLLKQLPAQRKIYVTPGLVDQGADSAKIHTEMGRLIASAEPDMVVLMQHSVTRHIQAGLEAASYKGELLIETDPLNFYQNLEVFVANGDLVMLQNDWPDNYL